MKYNITHADGTSLVFDDEIVDRTSTSLVLAGQSNSDYSYYLWNNIVHLLENFANKDSPNNKIVGQLWYDNSKSVLNVYTGQKWQSVAAQVEDMSMYALHQDSVLTGNLILPDNPISSATNIAVTRGYVETNYSYKFKTESTATIKYIRHYNNYMVCHSIISPATTDVRSMTVLLPYSMADDNYSISLSINSVDKITHGDTFAFTTDKTKLGFTIIVTNTVPSIAWVVMGFTE